MMMKRERLEELESQCLAPYAILSARSKGRLFPEDDDPYRLCFQRDKERVIHSKAFRRLNEKTQVFMAGTGDHYRTRLTHTLEVAQISRGIARRLGLNEDLAEVIALSHDLGHPPFGHGGEEALDEAMQEYGLRFEHNQQSQRVVQKLEKAYPDFEGLNLSVEVLDGLIKHQTAFDQAGVEFEVAAHLEAQVVNFGDEIAYTNHDVDDGLRSGLITLESLSGIRLWNEAENLVTERYGKNVSLIENKSILINRVISEMIGMMIDDLCLKTEENILRQKISGVEDVRSFQGRIVEFSVIFWDKLKEMRAFLFENFYLNPKVVAKTEEGKMMIKAVFKSYMRKDGANPEQVKDYIAGMTDGFLATEYSKLSIND